MSKFTDSIERELEGVHFFSVGPCPGCSTCFEHAEDAEHPTDEEYDAASESHFSWSRCDSCGSSLGGDRHPAHGIIADSMEAARGSEVEHFEICVDCLMFHANGDEPEEGEG